MTRDITSDQVLAFERRLNNIMQTCYSAEDAMRMAKGSEMKNYWERMMQGALGTKEGILWVLDRMNIDYEIIRRRDGRDEYKLFTRKNGF